MTEPTPAWQLRSGTWMRLYRDATGLLPDGVRSAIVPYADAAHADSPRLDEVLSALSEIDCDAVLIDTFSKQADTLFDYLSEGELRGFIDAARVASEKGDRTLFSERDACDVLHALENPLAEKSPVPFFRSRCHPLLAIAGSINQDTLSRVMPLRPDLIGVRGAVCTGDRHSPLCQRRVLEFRDAMRLLQHAFS